MSSLGARVSLGAVLLCLVPTPQQAQTAPTANTQYELLLEIDSLVERSREARAALRRTQQHRLEVTREAFPTTLDTVVVASLRIVTLPDQVEMASELFGEVMREHYLGVERHGAFDDVWFTFQWQTQLQPIHVEGPEYRVESVRALSRQGVKERIDGMVWLALTHRVIETETGLSGWRVASNFKAPREWRTRVYREFATMPVQAARSCLKEDPAACWAVLGLDLGPNPERVWYTPAERQAMVVRLAHLFHRREEDLQGQCTDLGSIEACDELIESLPRFYWEPSSQRAKSIMLSVALEAGGTGAWARLLGTSAETPGDVLRHVSGLSTGELSTRWRDLILTSRPNVHAGFGMTQLFTALWVLLFASLAVRSTRWRLG